MSILKPHIEAMSAYCPPLEGRNPDQHLLLDFNERTLPVGEHVRAALIDYVQSGRMQMYPSYGNLVDKIASYVGVNSDQVMITNGSDQGIDLLFRAVCNAKDEAIIPAPNFAMYKQCAGIEDLKVIEPAYSKADGFPTAKVIASITSKTKIICVSNPSNPSGTMVSVDDITSMAKAAPNAAILVDECYFEYAKVTAVDKVIDFPNIVVTRTFSKTWGIPSLRLGYVVAHPKIIAGLLNVRGPYDVNQLAVVAVNAALDHPDYTTSYVREIMHVSKPKLENFLTSHNIDFWPSGANYLWTFFNDPERIHQELSQVGILVRPKNDTHGNMGLRITLGNSLQTEKFISELSRILSC